MNQWNVGGLTTLGPSFASVNIDLIPRVVLSRGRCQHESTTGCRFTEFGSSFAHSCGSAWRVLLSRGRPAVAHAAKDGSGLDHDTDCSSLKVLCPCKPLGDFSR